MEQEELEIRFIPFSTHTKSRLLSQESGLDWAYCQVIVLNNPDMLTIELFKLVLETEKLTPLRQERIKKILNGERV